VIFKVKFIGLALASVVVTAAVANEVASEKTHIVLTLNAEANVQASRIYLNDVASCSGPVNDCREMAGIELQSSPSPGKNLLINKDTVVSIIQKEQPELELSIEGSNQVKVTGQQIDVKSEDVRLDLQNWLRTKINLAHDIKVFVTKVSIPLGSGIRPSQTKLEFPDLDGLADRNVDWISKNLVGVRLTQLKFVNVADDQDYQFVNAQVYFSVERLMPVAARAIQSGLVVRPQDVSMQWITVRRGAFDFADSEEQILGKRLRNVVPSGEPFNVRYLDAPMLVARNQPVTVIMRNSGVEISAKAMTIDAGAKGQIVDVVNSSNKKRIRARVVDQDTVEAITF
jgi:flagella basal body P-ring formation protein FlgA